MKLNAPNRVTTVHFLSIMIGIVVFLYLGKSFLIPLAFGGFFAMIFYPMIKWLKKKGVPKWGGIGIAALIFILIPGIVILTTVLQTKSLVQDWPKISKQLKKQQENIEDYIIKQMGIGSEERMERYKKRLRNQLSEAKTLIKGFFGSMVSSITGIVLALVYMIIFLLEDRRITKFIVNVTPTSNEDYVRETLQISRNVAFQYLKGRIILIGILSIFYSVGFLAFGLEYAISIAIIAAILSIIPYLGNIIGGMIAVIIALATTGSMSTVLGVLGTMVVAQFFESNVLTPWIMGERVSLNPLATMQG